MLQIAKNLGARLRQEASGDALSEIEELGSLAAKSLPASLTSVEVVLALLTSNELPILGHLNALRK